MNDAMSNSPSVENGLDDDVKTKCGNRLAGPYYWCVKTFPAGEIYAYADRLKFCEGSISLEEARGDGSPVVVLALAKGRWRAAYLANLCDGSAVAVERWAGEVKDATRSIPFGDRYWEVQSSLSQSGEIFLLADCASTSLGGVAEFATVDESGVPITVLAVASGNWDSYFAADGFDGSPVAIEHWTAGYLQDELTPTPTSKTAETPSCDRRKRRKSPTKQPSSRNDRQRGVDARAS